MLAIWLTWGVVTGLPEWTPEQLATAHGQSVEAIYSIDCTAEVEVRRRMGQSVSPFQLQSRMRWRRAGDRERIQGEWPANRVDRNGNLQGREDILRDGDVVKILSNWDWQDPPDISPTRPRSARGSVIQYEPEQGLSNFDVPMVLLLYGLLGVHHPRVPLIESLRMFGQAAVVPCSRTGPGGESVVCLRLSQPRGLRYLEPDHLVELDLVPALNFLVARSAVIRPACSMPDATGKRITCRYEMVQEVRRAEEHNGIWIPVELVGTTQRVGLEEPFESARTHVVVHSLNEPLAEEAFTFLFPDQLTVTDMTRADPQGRPLISIWGPADQPEFQTHDANDLARRYGQTGPSVSGVAVIALVAPLLVLIVAWIRLRRRPVPIRSRSVA